MKTLRGRWRVREALWVGGLVFLSSTGALAPETLDAAGEAAERPAEIGELFAWTSSDGRHLNLAMTLASEQFSDRLQYVFHVDSGARVGETGVSTAVICRFDTPSRAECWAGDADYARGDAGQPAGLVGRNGRFRVFAGLRDEPPLGQRNAALSALAVASAALQAGAGLDAAGCPHFDEATSRTILERWRRADDAPATNLPAGQRVPALVVAIDLDVVDRGGKLLAVWGAAYRP